MHSAPAGLSGEGSGKVCRRHAAEAVWKDWTKMWADMTAKQAASEELVREKAAEPRPSGAFGRITEADRVPVLDVEKLRPH